MWSVLDRIYLTGYVPTLQVSGQVVNFLTHHLGFPIASPAVFEQIGTRFRAQVRGFAAECGVPVVRFVKGDRKIEVMRLLLARAAAAGRPGVVAVGTAQEFQRVFIGAKCSGEGEAPRFAFTRNDRRTTCYYFYLWDAEFGPAFVKICAYFPYPMKICLLTDTTGVGRAGQATVRSRLVIEHDEPRDLAALVVAQVGALVATDDPWEPLRLRFDDLPE